MKDDDAHAWMSEMKNDAELQAFVERQRPFFQRLSDLFGTETSAFESFVEDESTLVHRSVDLPDLMRGAIQHLQGRWVEPEVKHTVATAMCNMYLDPGVLRFIASAFRSVQQRNLQMADHPWAEFALALKKHAIEVSPARRGAIEHLWCRLGAKPPEPVALIRAHSLLMSCDTAGASQRRMREMLDVYQELVETRYRCWLTLLAGTLRPLYDAPDADPTVARHTLGRLVREVEDALRDVDIDDPSGIADRRCVQWRNAVAHRNLEFDPLDDAVKLWNESEGRRHSEERVTSEEIADRLADLLGLVGFGGGLDGALGGSLSQVMDAGVLSNIMRDIEVGIEAARPTMTEYLATGNLQLLQLAGGTMTFDAAEVEPGVGRHAS